MTTEVADVLLAEDNPSDAELILESLAAVVDPARIHRVHDGVEALDFLTGGGAHARRSADAPLRLVLLDIKLPRVDGLEVLRHVREDLRTRLVPVVMLTSSKVERDVQTAYALGASGYVQKPVDFTRFREVLRCMGTFWLSINEAPGWPGPVSGVGQ
ncbi:MAG TPA: response regulator [Candidatus Limnocylindrales bacterium]|nr:response regulator [Candidatus Limnocylindrales bacterium]